MADDNLNIKSSEYDKNVSPVWAQLLYKGISKRDKLEKGMQDIKHDPSLLLKGLVGKSLLDRYIDPFLSRALPDSVKLDVLKQNLLYSPSRKLDISLGKKGKTTNLGFNWRF